MSENESENILTANEKVDSIYMELRREFQKAKEYDENIIGLMIADNERGCGWFIAEDCFVMVVSFGHQKL